jgi:chemotaxis protein CheD
MIEAMLKNSVVNQESILVGLGELKVTRSPSVVFSCLGIGSCIAICVFDQYYKVGGMAHIVLPHCDGRVGDNLGKYADTSVPLLVDEVIKQGGSRARLTIKIAGGAQMSLAPGLKNTFKTGERNLEEVRAAVERQGLTIAGAETGGNKGRTVKMYVDTCRVTVKSAGEDERDI